MSIQPVVIPPNTNRLNPYNEFDRGLFKYTNNQNLEKYARIAKASWVGQGDINSPGVLSYQIESFRRLPKTKGELSFYSEGIQPMVYTTITRNSIVAPNVLEAFAIRHFLGARDIPTVEVIRETHRVSKMILATVTNRKVLSMDTKLDFEAPPEAPLAYKEGSIQYTGILNDGEEVEGLYLLTTIESSTTTTVLRLLRELNT